MRKNKKQRKQIKAVRLKNKKILKKYPWLSAIDWWWNPINTYDFTLLDDMPEGWRKCFGMMMIEDMEKARAGRLITSQQVKEKYGQLEWYCDAPQEVQDVITAYSILSRNICINCGQVDVGYTRGWISPICKRCWDKHCEGNYYEEISPHTRMQLDYGYRALKDGEWKDYIVNISEYTNKVRVNWWKHHKE